MNIKKYAIWGLTLSLSVIMLTGCTQSADPIKNNDDSQSTSPVSAVEDNTPAPDYDIVGEVIEIDGQDVHILTGDIVDIYTVTSTQDIYLGERVQIINQDGRQVVKPFIVENFDVKHTSMGQTIEKITGKIEKVSETSFDLRTDSDLIRFEYYGETSEIHEGMTTDVEFIRQYGDMEKNLAIHAYNLESAMTLTVDDLSRSEDGLLIAKCSDAEGMASYVKILPGTNDNFNISKLEISDKIQVIPDVIMESYPLQINPERVRIVE